MKETIIQLNNKAVVLSNRLETKKAIETFQRASILCNPAHERLSWSSKTIPTIEKCLNQEELGGATPYDSNHREIESDEGLNTFAMPLSIAEEGNHDSFSYADLETILSCNLGICYLSLAKPNKYSSELYFNRAEALLSHDTVDRKPLRDFGYGASFQITSHTLLNNRGLLNFRLKKYGHARLCYERALDESIVKYGERSLPAAQALNSIGVTYFAEYASSLNKQEWREHALQYLTKSLSIQADLRNQNVDLDLDIATVKNNIGNVKFILNEYESAYSFYEDAYQTRRNALGDHHIDTCIAAFNAGKCLHCLGKHAAALNFYDIFVKSIFSSRSLKLLTKETFLALQSIARFFHQGRSFQNAKKFYELALRVANKAFGKKHKLVSRLLIQFGNLSFEFGHMTSALEYYLAGLEINYSLQSFRKSDEPSTIATLSNVARAYEILGCLAMSLKTFKLIIEIIRSHNTTEIASTKNQQRIEDILPNLARVYQKMGRSDLALRVMLKALDTQRQEYGNNHSFVATTLNEIGIIYGGQGQTLFALKNFEESYRIRTLLKDPERDLSTILFNIACTHVQNGDNLKSIVLFDEVVQLELSKRKVSDLCKDRKNASPEALLEALEQMTRILNNDLDNPHEALICCEKGIRISTEETRVVSPNVRSKFLGMAGNICLEMGDMERAMYFFSKSMRTNVAGGLAFDANIKVIGYDFHKFDINHPRSAAAA